MKVEPPREDSLVITRFFDAPRELVFKAWTDVGHLLKWFGPTHHPATHMKLDARPGGVWRGCLIGVENGEELWLGGVFHELVKFERIVFTFAWEEAGERGLETVVTITLTEEAGKTQMLFHQTPFQSREQRDGHHEGWGSCFDRLAELLANL